MNEKLTIEQLVERVNSLIESETKDVSKDSRMSTEVTVRMVRSYMTSSMMDKPMKEGRNTYFNEQHVNQILGIRKMQLEGLPTKYISSIIGSYGTLDNVNESPSVENFKLNSLNIGSSMDAVINGSLFSASSANATTTNNPLKNDAMAAIRSIQEKSNNQEMVKDHLSKSQPQGRGINYMDSFKMASKSYQEFPLDKEAKISLKIETGYTIKDKEQILERIKQILNI